MATSKKSKSKKSNVRTLRNHIEDAMAATRRFLRGLVATRQQREINRRQAAKRAKRWRFRQKQKAKKRGQQGETTDLERKAGNDETADRGVTVYLWRRLEATYHRTMAYLLGTPYRLGMAYLQRAVDLARTADVDRAADMNGKAESVEPQQPNGNEETADTSGEVEAVGPLETNRSESADMNGEAEVTGTQDAGEDGEAADNEGNGDASGPAQPVSQARGASSGRYIAPRPDLPEWKRNENWRKPWNG